MTVEGRRFEGIQDTEAAGTARLNTWKKHPRCPGNGQEWKDECFQSEGESLRSMNGNVNLKPLPYISITPYILSIISCTFKPPSALLHFLPSGQYPGITFSWIHFQFSGSCFIHPPSWKCLCVTGDNDYDCYNASLQEHGIATSELLVQSPQVVSEELYCWPLCLRSPCLHCETHSGSFQGWGDLRDETRQPGQKLWMA